MIIINLMTLSVMLFIAITFYRGLRAARKRSAILEKYGITWHNTKETPLDPKVQKMIISTSWRNRAYIINMTEVTYNKDLEPLYYGELITYWMVFPERVL